MLSQIPEDIVAISWRGEDYNMRDSIVKGKYHE